MNAEIRRIGALGMVGVSGEMESTKHQFSTRRQRDIPCGGSSHASSAKAYWSGNMDPQNLERKAASVPKVTLRDEIVFASTPDVEAARSWLLKAHRTPGCIMDLGAGLGAVSFALARRGSWILAVDSSIERLHQLRGRAREAHCAGSISPMVADAEALPFHDGALPAILSKSVLIHTNLPRTTSEIARVLSPGGRAALIEPQKNNPFAWIYRRTLAPRDWRSITRYFGADEQAICFRNIGPGRVKPFFLFSFLAFFFQFARPNLTLFSRMLGVLHRLDQFLFDKIQWTRSFAWFGVIQIEKPTPPSPIPVLRDHHPTKL